MNVVHKYGGSSVATIEKIKAVAQRVAEVYQAGDKVAVVASAMGKTTNELIALANEMGDNISPRELDSLLSTGEQKTVTLLAMALQALGVPAVSLTGYQAGFVTNRNHSHAKIQDINIDTLKRHVDAGRVPVIAGFQGMNEDGDITTFGRGGSDTTAVAIAAKLGWECQIYTDVDGIYTVDPRKCPGARKLDRITYDEMMEMASLGAGVLETRSVELAKKYNVPLFLGRALERDLTRGTYILNTLHGFEDMPVTGISITEDCAMLSVRYNAAAGGAADLFSVIADLDINVDMISQQTLGGSDYLLSFSCSGKNAALLQRKIESENLPYSLEHQQQLMKLSLVGVGMITHSGIAAKVFRILTDAGIRFYQITTSEISISLTLDVENGEKAVALLAKAFDLCE